MTLQQQLKEVQREHPQAWIGYNANTGKHSSTSFLFLGVIACLFKRFE